MILLPQQRVAHGLTLGGELGGHDAGKFTSIPRSSAHRRGQCQFQLPEGVVVRPWVMLPSFGKQELGHEDNAYKQGNSPPLPQGKLNLTHKWGCGIRGHRDLIEYG